VAVVWGEAEVVLHTDGRSLPGEVEAATSVAAAQGAKTFERVFKKEMRKAIRNSVKDIARNLGDLVATLLLSSGAMRRLYEATVHVRRGFRSLGSTVNTFTSNSLRKLTGGFREFGDAIRVDAIRTMDMLREGATHLKINLDDLQQTFPGITRGVRAIGNGFRYVRDEAVGFGTILRNDAVKTMDSLREGASHLKINLDDLRDTFPGLTRVVRGTRSAFARVREEVKALGPDMDFVRPATERLRESFRSLGETLRGSRFILSLWRTEQKNYIENSEEVTAATEDTERSTNRLTRSVNKGVGGIRKYLASWKSLPHGFRQAVFWTGLVIAGMGSLSVLTSALSGTIVALVAQIGALVAGIGFAVAGFAGLYAEGTKLTEGAQASKDAFSALGDAFRQVREDITNNMFGGMADSISNITNTLLPALEGNIATFAQTTGESLGRIFDALSSPAGVENFKALLDGFSPILESLTTAAITFGDAIADILVASLPTAQLFADAIADVGTQFSTWTSSEEGRARLAEFFATAERIMPLLVDLVVAFADALAQLVTPTTISGFETFVTSMTNFMPILGQIVGVVANLNVFGILAAALETIGALLAPLLPVLATFATILGETLITALQTLAPAFTTLGTSLAPVLTIIGDLVIAILPPLIDIIVRVIENVAAWIDMILALAEVLLGGEEGVKVFGQVVTTVFQVIGGVITFTTSIITGVLKAVTALLKGDTAGAFKFLEDAVRQAFEGIGIDFDDFIQWCLDLWNNVSKFFGKIGDAISDFGDTVADVFGAVGDWISDAIGWFGSLFGAANKASGAASGARQAAASGGGGSSRPMATGGLLNGPTRILAGEAGPEAIVPLRRSLNMVDPSVRWLSAIAQGKDPAFAGGGVVGGGKSVTIEAGAIQIVGNQDPARTSLSVLNRLAERIAG
jgi:phage-related protein